MSSKEKSRFERIVSSSNYNWALGFLALTAVVWGVEHSKKNDAPVESPGPKIERTQSGNSETDNTITTRDGSKHTIHIDLPTAPK